MKKVVSIFLFLLSVSTFASFKGGNTIFLRQGITENQGGEIIREMFLTGPTIYSSPFFIFHQERKGKNYPKGDFVILWGLGESESNQNMTENEYKMIWRIMNYLSSLGFRVIMNVRTEVNQIKEAVQTPGVSVILYSGHGNTSGFYDYFNNLVPYDLFRFKAKSLYQFILSACYGSESRLNYENPSNMILYTWPGLTNSKDLEGFLMNSWNADEGANLLK